MRYINIDNLELPSGWNEKANMIIQELNEKPTIEEKKAFIKTKEYLWKELRDELRKLSHNKCWYTEAPIIGFTPHIDHFRPKLNVRDLNNNSREGYWWLAFNKKNFRLSCEFANCIRIDHDIRYGKGDFFPLTLDSQIATNEGELILEKPLLLDPTKKEDINLLYFDVDGRIYCKDSSSENIERVNVTKDLLHLEHSDFINARIQKINECKRWIKELKMNINSFGLEDTRTKEKIIYLKELMNEKSPFSKCAEDYFKSLDENTVEIIFA